MSNFLEDLKDEKNNERLVQSVELASHAESKDQASHARALPHRFRVVNESDSPTVVHQNLRPILARTQSKQALLTRTASMGSIPRNEPPPAVTLAFVEEFNNNRGISEYIEKAKIMMRRTRILGGLQLSDALRETGHIDIPSARKNFAILAQLDDHNLKTQALDNLILMLRNDQLKKETAFDLIPLAIDIMKQMDRELMQTQLVEVQVKICTVYSLAAELIQSHYGKHFLGGITKELKEQLTITSSKLEDLNSHNDQSLHFLTSYAYEGIRRLIDDRKPLFELGDRLAHALFAGLSFFQNGDTFSAEVKGAFGDIKLHFKHSWYDHAHICNLSIKKAQMDPQKLAVLQGFIDMNWKELNWKFLYNAIDILTDISLNGKSETIRRNALAGSRTKKMSFPGLIDYLGVEQFKSKHDMRNIAKFKKPVKRDYNLIVRRHVIEQLQKIALAAPDAIVRKTAKLNLLEHYQKGEKNQELRVLLQSMIPKGPRKTQDWLNEIGHYTWKPVVDPLFIPLEEQRSNSEDSVQGVALASFSEGMPLVFEGANITMVPATDALDANVDAARGAHNTHKAKRPPSVLIKSLSDCLGVDPDFVRTHLSMDGNILPIGNDNVGLKISEKGMQDIAQLVQHSNAISIINFDGCMFDPEAFYPLSEAAKSPAVIHLRLDIPLEGTAAMALAESIIENDKLGIVLGSPQDYVLLGHALEIKGYTNEAIAYYQQGLDLNKHPALDNMMRAKLYYRQGKAHILNSDSEQAIECWKKALKNEPDSVPTLLYLSRFLIESGDPHTAKKYAAKALELQPTNERAKEYLQAASEPSSPEKSMKKGLLDN